MKIFSTILLSMALLATAFTACKKDDSSSPSYFVSAKIDGVVFNTDSIIPVVGAGQMTFTSAKGAEKIILYIPENATTGNHNINFTTYNILYFDKAGAIYTAQSGAINISKYDAAGKSIEGSFSAHLYNGTANPVLSDGAFKIKF